MGSRHRASRAESLLGRSGPLLCLAALACTPRTNAGASERPTPAPVASAARAAASGPAAATTPTATATATATATSAAASAVAPAWPPAPPGARSDFCIDSVSVLDESTCYVLPDVQTDELLIYLHGIVPPSRVSRQKTNFETVVALASRRAGVAALMPRGRLGLAPRGHERWWGWPTSRGAYAQLAEELVQELASKRQKLEQLTGRQFRRLYLAGSSSGAYFVTALALQGALPADGYGIISGAADRADAGLDGLARRPIYIGFGTQDTVGGAAKALGARLKRAGFPVQVAAHPLPHGTAEVYLDEAFAHFRAHAP